VLRLKIEKNGFSRLGRDSSSQYVQYGCGLSVAKGWRNFDGSPRLRIEKTPILGRVLTRNSLLFPEEVDYGDVVKGLPIAPGSCKGVYCSHVLEHLCLRDCQQALRNTLRVLAPGGIFRLVIPDLQASIQLYLNNGSAQAASDFMRETCLGHETRQRGLMGMLSAWLGNSPHLWMWDFNSMREALEQAGFVQIRRAAFGDSEDPMFQNVEEKVRWDGCLGFECRRPA
jgi:predicted SAM-dependent methyltransferase